MGYRGSEGVAMAQAGARRSAGSWSAASVQDRVRLRAGWLRRRPACTPASGVSRIRWRLTVVFIVTEQVLWNQ